MSQNDPKLPVALIVPLGDVELARAFDLPATLLAGDMDEGSLVLTELGQSVVPATQTARVNGCLVLSAEGKAMAEALVEGWGAATGKDLPVLDLVRSGQIREAEVLRELARLCVERLGAFAQHNAQLLEMLAVLRAETEDQICALRKTRNFLLQTTNSQRWLAQAHGPLQNGTNGPFHLAPGTTLVQRLSAGSAGLSDIGVFLSDQALPATGSLEARSHLVESGVQAGVWELPVGDLSTGWLRLTLLDALDDDEQSVDLELRWQGEGSLLLGAGLHHPDPAYCAELDGERSDRLLAHRIWKYLPGAAAPLPADGHWRIGRGNQPVYVDPEHLSRAIPADPDNACLQFFKGLGALQVHPRQQGVSAARLMRAAVPRISEIKATVGGRDERVPAVEYALAVAPHHPLREVGDLLAECARKGYLSDWMQLRGDRQGELSLILPEPLERDCDLFLVTRLAPGEQQAYGWAMFRDIRMTGPA